ncbi:hypothetical protein SynRS9915_00517 [Synechococcus sp. RS9915]|nr:hypothetical protein SynRS9915_00517 [Synechococcus sp. RS9915]
MACHTRAMSDPIRNGENGHRVPTVVAMTLAAALEQLAKHHPSPPDSADWLSR